MGKSNAGGGLSVSTRKKKPKTKKKTGQLWRPQVCTNFVSAREKHLRKPWRRQRALTQPVAAISVQAKSLSDANGNNWKGGCSSLVLGGFGNIWITTVICRAASKTATELTIHTIGKVDKPLIKETVLWSWWRNARGKPYFAFASLQSFIYFQKKKKKNSFSRWKPLCCQGCFFQHPGKRRRQAASTWANLPLCREIRDSRCAPTCTTLQVSRL